MPGNLGRIPQPPPVEDRQRLMKWLQIVYAQLTQLSALATDGKSQSYVVSGARLLAGNMNAGAYKITNLAAPTAATDAPNKDYVDAADNTKAPSSAEFIVAAMNSGLSAERLLAGTANQVILTLAATTATLSLPQNVHSAATPILAGLTLTSIVTFAAALMTLTDAVNIVVGTTTGTKIGTAASQKLGFYGATPVTQRSDSGALTDNVGGTVDGTLAAIPNPADTPADADALRDDLVANTLPPIRDAVSDLASQVNALRTVLRDLGFMA